MKAIMLRNSAIRISCESRFEEEFLEPIIIALEKGENKGFSLFANTNKGDGLGFMTIETKIPKEVK